MTLDEAFRSIGDHGRGQLLILILICSMGQLPASWHIFAVVFLGAIPDHYCNPPYEELEDRNSTYGNTSGWNDGTMYQKCELQVNNQTDTCYNGWTYSSEPYGTTIVSQVRVIACDFIQSSYKV